MPEQELTSQFDVNLTVAGDLAQDSKYSESEAAYKAMLRQFGERPEIFHGLAHPLRMQGKHAELMDGVVNGIRISQENILFLYGDAMDGLRTGNRAKDGFPGRNFPGAISFLSEGEALAAKMPGESLAKVHFYTNAGLLFTDMGIQDAALEYYIRAEHNARKLVEQDPANDEYADKLARTLHTKGVTEEKLGKYNEALSSQNEAYPILERLGDKRNLCNVLSSRGDLSKIGGQETQARNDWEEGLEIALKSKDREYIDIFTKKLAQLQNPPA